MNTKSQGATPSSRNASREVRSPESRVRASVRAHSRSTEHGIRDAVQDQHGVHWIRYGTGDRAVWFSIPDLITAERDVFQRLSLVGVHCLVPATQARIKREIEAHSTYRDALVADRPGWCEGHYVFGDSAITSPPADPREIIVAFEADPKFTPVGTLDAWQATVGPLVAQQPLPLFSLAFAFVGPLMRFLPSGYLNPSIEIVGRRESGKSTLGVLAASAWAGRPYSDHGGGASWDLTLNALDDHKRRHRDNLLYLDEGNLAGRTPRERGEFLQQAVFKLAGTGQRRRFGDKAPSDHASLAVLSTTNTPLFELVEATSEVRGALQSRMITIRIGSEHQYGVLTSIPAGCSSARDAIERLRASADENYGVAGREFIRRLARQVAVDEELLRRVINRSLAYNMTRLVGSEVGSARVEKTLALIAVAGALAQRWGILPLEWGSLTGAIREVHRSVAGVRPEPAPQTALDRVRAYARRFESELVNVADLRQPLRPEEFAEAPGFVRLREGQRELLVPAARFRREFRDCETIMRELRDAGLAQTEAGEQSKLTIKAPRAICETGRVYCIQIG